MPRINKKYESLLFAVTMSIVITLPMSFFMTFFNIGLAPFFFSAFLQSCLIGLVISIPISYFVIPYIQRFVGYLIRN